MEFREITRAVKTSQFERVRRKRENGIRKLVSAQNCLIIIIWWLECK